MERKINKKIEEAFANYKQDIKTGIVGVITAINCQIDEEYVSDITIKETVKTELMNLLQELYDHPVLKLDKTDFQKRKRVKNVVPLHDRCIACRANGEQCTRRRKGDSQFCGTHIKGTPHGVISKEKQNSEPKEMIKKVSVWAQDIKGIIYYIDDNSNVYETSAILQGTDNPKIIAKYQKSLDNEGNVAYAIPSFGI
tara:strand:- start:7631 stop:8221 length:591 start_codon:yes stop_codon:yes gene_type:complete